MDQSSGLSASTRGAHHNTNTQNGYMISIVGDGASQEPLGSLCAMLDSRDTSILQLQGGTTSSPSNAATTVDPKRSDLIQAMPDNTILQYCGGQFLHGPASVLVTPNVQPQQINLQASCIFHGMEASIDSRRGSRILSKPFTRLQASFQGPRDDCSSIAANLDIGEMCTDDQHQQDGSHDQMDLDIAETSHPGPQQGQSSTFHDHTKPSSSAFMDKDLLQTHSQDKSTDTQKDQELQWLRETLTDFEQTIREKDSDLANAYDQIRNLEHEITTLQDVLECSVTKIECLEKLSYENGRQLSALATTRNSTSNQPPVTPDTKERFP